jgi:PAS domain S-box-containing protein
MDANTSTIHVLSIEDNANDALLIQEMLADASRLGWNLPPFDIVHVSRLSEAMAYLDIGAIDVILTDLDLPDSRAGEKTFTRIHAHAPTVPIVVLTGREDEDMARRAVRAGAEDYLFKREMNGSLLAHALIYAIEREARKQALAEANEQLEQRVQARTAELADAHTKLHREHENLLNVFDAAPVGMLLINQETVIVEANQKAATLVLRDPAEIINQRVGHGLCCVNSFEDPRGCGYAHACTACPLRQGLEQVLTGGETLHDIEVSMDLLIDEQWQRRYLNVNATPITLNNQRQLIVAVEDVTDRHKTARALRESEMRFRTIVDILPQFVAYTDRDLRYRFINQTYQEKFGLTPDDVLDKTLPEVIGEEAFEEARPHVERALSGEHVRYHERYDYAIGGTRDIDGILVPDVAENGEVRGYYAVLTDITPYIETQEALHKSERALASSEREKDLILNATSEMVAYYRTPDLEIQWVNKAAAASLGIQPEAMINRRCYELWHGRDVPCASCPVLAAFETGSDQTEEITTPDGRIWSIRTYPIFDETEILGVVEFGLNITDRKQTEVALKESEQRYYTLFEHAPMMLWEEDFSEVCAYLKQLRAEGVKDVGDYFKRYPEELKACAAMIKVLAVNQENVNFFELSSKSEIGDTLPYAFVESSWDVFREELVALAQGKTTFMSEIPLQTKHGQVKIARLQLSVIPGHAATLSRVLISGVDITERQRLENELKASVAEKEVLLREIHHRVKNNLMVVTSLIKMQANQSVEPDAIALFRDLRNRVLAMTMVHEDLYQTENLARIDFGAYLHRLTQGIRQSFAPAAVALRVRANGVILDVEHAIPCGLIVAELVTNALNHAFPNAQADNDGTGPTPEIRVTMRRKDNTYVMIIQDNGVGLPPDIDPHAPQTLGLRLVRSWVRHQLKGELDVDTNAGGTTFTLSFTVSDSS